MESNTQQKGQLFLKQGLSTKNNNNNNNNKLQHYEQQQQQQSSEQKSKLSSSLNQHQKGILNDNILHNQKGNNLQRLGVKSPEKKTYNAEKIVGNGSFGVVFQASVVETGEIVAIKKVFQDKRYKNRELQILKELDHPNVTTLKHAFYTQGETPDEIFLNVVMDYMPETIYKIIKHYKKMKQITPPLLLKLYSYQIFRAIAYIHGLEICHRDIKPQNLLVDPSNHLLKLCDFGSAKKLIKGEPNVSYICSRYYRAPELIFGATNYDYSIDIWSIGCVIAEIMLGEPIFPGESGIDQLVEIIKILGTPTIEQVLAMNPACQEFQFPQIKTYHWTKVFKNYKDSQAIDLISKLLVYNPKERLTPLQALLHPFFDDLRNQNFHIPGAIIPDLFNFTREELLSAPYLLDRLIPSWYNQSMNIE